MTELIKQKKQVPERLYSNKKLAALLIPLALDQLLNSFMGTIDTLVVSNLGSAAISAVSLVDSINILIVQAFFALASGGTVVCSHYLGCKSKDHAKEAARQLVFVTLMLSLIIGAADFKSDFWKSRKGCYGRRETIFLLLCAIISVYRTL